VKFESVGEMRGGVWWSVETSSFCCWTFDGDRHNFDTGSCRLGVSGEEEFGGLGSSGGSGGSGFI
jgi:hypothetical protein